MAKSKKAERPKEDPLAIKLQCGCQFHFRKWRRCTRALELEKECQGNFAKRKAYNEHFTNQFN